jgi:hypothetical protein
MIIWKGPKTGVEMLNLPFVPMVLFAYTFLSMDT